MGDYRTYDHTVGIRAVTSIDGMTSDFARIDWEVLQKFQVELSMRWTTLIALSMTLPTYN